MKIINKILGNEYKEHKFSKINRAKIKQQQLQKKYGYIPEIFRVSKNKKFIHYTIVEPRIK